LSIIFGRDKGFLLLNCNISKRSGAKISKMSILSIFITQIKDKIMDENITITKTAINPNININISSIENLLSGALSFNGGVGSSII
jgi:hypothetical protein